MAFFIEEHASIPLEVESVTEMGDTETHKTAFRIRFKELSDAQLSILQNLDVTQYPAYVDYVSDGTITATYMYISAPSPK